MKLAVCSIALAVAFAFTFSSPAHAQSSEDQQARALFDAGRTAYEAGRFEQALRYFREAYDLSHRPALLFNIASAADRLLEIDTALEAYRAYLAAVPDAENRELAEARIRFLESRRAGTGGSEDTQRVPTPEEAARTVVADDRATSTDEAPSGGGDVTSEWWFWTIIAVVAVGAIAGITAGIVLGTSSVEEPLQGDVPITMALEGR